MDGVGRGRRDQGDAVFLARTPTLDALEKTALFTELAAHGTAVGLPSDDDMGNSEVGHNALGAGRIFDQGAKLVNEAIRSGRMFEGQTWRTAVSRCVSNGAALHFIGLLSDGNVHSHIDHLIAMLRRAKSDGVKQVRVHALLDGRDVPETSALEYVDKLERVLAGLSDADCDYRVASGGGRMKVTMDRYNADWAMVERGYNAHVHGQARAFASLREAVETLRQETPGIGDQNLPAFVIADANGPVGPIRSGAAVVFFNFRGDRAIEITRAFEDDKFEHFDRGQRPEVFYAGMMQYDGDLALPRAFLVSPPEIDRTLGEYLATAKISQLAISETQKYGHVTYFWNGNRSGKFDDALETYIEVPSDTLPFEERPWMKAAEITDRVISELKTGKHRHVRINFANGDMVGHTGALEATILAVSAVDLMLARILPVVRALGGATIVTADHGNADEMFEWDKKAKGFTLDAHGNPRPKTSHTLNRVPCYIDVADPAIKLRPLSTVPSIAAIPATVLNLMGFEAPDGYLPSLLEV
jgi:2,3-bisphosphoglycerate-independent phosphoglycerate mutase